MTDKYEALKVAALATKPLVDGSYAALTTYYAAASSDVVLGLIAERDALAAKLAKLAEAYKTATTHDPQKKQTPPAVVLSTALLCRGLRDDEIAKLVSTITRIALVYHDHESLRQHMSGAILAALKPQHNASYK